MQKRSALDSSGWRSVVEAAKAIGVPVRAMYGKVGGFSPSVNELIRRGLAETQVTVGGRGRGGETTRIRLAYDRRPVQEFVDAKIGRPSEEVRLPFFSPPKYRLAVLPFEYIGDDRANEYLADGLTEELIGRLSQIRGFDVIARTSVMALKKSQKTVEEIGKGLRVGAVIEGSLRKEGSSVRVSVQLVDTATSGHLWSAVYGRMLDDVFALQSYVAEKVAQALEVRVLPVEESGIRKRATDNSEARLLYAKGREKLLKSSDGAVRESLSCFEGAVQRDPSFAAAYAGIADSYSMMGDRGLIPQDEAISRAESAARTAVNLDEGLAEAHTALAPLYYHRYDWRGAEKELRRAVELKPSFAQAHAWLGAVLRNTGRTEEALVEFRRAFELDPLSSATGCYVALGHIANRRPDEALAQLRALPPTDEDPLSFHTLMGFAYVQNGMFKDAVEEMQKAVALSPPDDPIALGNLGIAYAKLGNMVAARRIMKEIMGEADRRNVPTDVVAVLNLVTGEREVALELLSKAVDERCSRWIPMMRVSALFDPLRGDRRFMEILERAHLA